MALDFYRLDSDEYIFGLEDKQVVELNEIFSDFKFQTGLAIDQFGDFKMSVENQTAIIRIVDKFLESGDLNKDKSKTMTIIEFRTYLKYYSQRDIGLKLKGD